MPYNSECWGEDEMEYGYAYDTPRPYMSAPTQNYVYASTAVECGEDCMTTITCRYWTYHLPTQWCFKYWTNFGKIKNKDTVSGRQLCQGINIFGDENNRLVKKMAEHTKWLEKGEIFVKGFTRSPSNSDLSEFYENLDRSQWEEKGKRCLSLSQRGTWLFQFCDTLRRPLCQITYKKSSKTGI